MNNRQVAGYCLEYFVESDAITTIVPLQRRPFHVGRSRVCDYVLPSQTVSKVHAEFFVDYEQLILRDLNSTNGTFVNGRRIQSICLQHGDIIQIGNKEMRLVFGSPANHPESQLTEPKATNKSDFIQRRDVLKHVLRRGSVRAVFQPIMKLANRDVVGYEALGRAVAEEGLIDTAQLFATADKCRLAVDLSHAFRTAAVKDCGHIAKGKFLFVNVHSKEMLEPTFFESLQENLVKLLPASCQIVLEVHENAILDMEALRAFRKETWDMGLKLAYDDFGVGQARLAELAEVPPDFVKLDMRIVRDLEQSSGRQDLIKALRRLADQLGFVLLAEGLETEEETELCRNLGCELGQGYFLGRPKSVGMFANPAQSHVIDLTAVFDAARRE